MPSKLECFAGIISNPIVSDNFRLSVFLYDRDDSLVLALRPNEQSFNYSFVATHLRVYNDPLVRKWYFPSEIRLNPGDALVFSLGVGVRSATIFVKLQATYSFELVREVSPDPMREHALMTAHTDMYLTKLYALAQVHAMLGSTRAQFEEAVAQSGLEDDTELKKLTKDQFNAVNNANATIQLKGDKTVDGDQTIYDETAMLACCINTSIAATANALHPEQYDITTEKGRLDMMNATANGLFNFFHSHMGPFMNTVSMSKETISHTYNTATIQLDVIRDLFASLALPEAALNDLLGAVQSFVKDMQTLSAKLEDKTKRNAKLVNFFSVQPPLGNPDLKHLTKMRMIYCQFNEAVATWSTGCASGESYSLSITIYVLDCELNRQVVHLAYKKNIERIERAADVVFGDIGKSGLNPTTPPVQVPGSNPIGPPPVPL